MLEIKDWGIKKMKMKMEKILYKRRDDAKRPGIETDMIYFTWIQLYLSFKVPREHKYDYDYDYYYYYYYHYYYFYYYPTLLPKVFPLIHSTWPDLQFLAFTKITPFKPNGAGAPFSSVKTSIQHTEDTIFTCFSSHLLTHFLTVKSE